MTEKRCLKFTGYIFLPEKSAKFNELRYLSGRTPGRITVFDEQNNKPSGKAFAFENLGQMIDKIEKEKQKRIYRRVKRK
jgi:hypothetical protein